MAIRGNTILEMSTSPRVAKTKTYLKDALIALLDKESFQNVTVKAICEKAAVNRSTFYAYYSCPRDLIEEIERDILSKLPVYESEEGKPFMDSFLPFMQYIKDNGATFRVLMSASVDESFAQTLVKTVMDKYGEFMNIEDKTEKRMCFLYCINGVVGIVREWIRTDFAYPIEKVSKLIVDLTFRSVGLPYN